LYAQWPDDSIPPWLIPAIAIGIPAIGLGLTAIAGTLLSIPLVGRLGLGFAGLLALPKLLFGRNKDVCCCDPCDGCDCDCDCCDKDDPGNTVKPPQTGDNGAAVLSAALMLMLLTGGAAVVLGRKRKDEEMA